MGRLRQLSRARATRRSEQGREDARVTAVDVDDLGAARAARDQADGAATDTERIGHRGQRRLGRFAVYRLRAYPDDQGAVVPAADPGTRRAGLDPDGNPHVISIGTRGYIVIPNDRGHTVAVASSPRCAILAMSWRLRCPPAVRLICL
jgi:hypothetical protein